MTVSVATLGDRALLRLGVVVVPLAQRPALTVVMTVNAIATAALAQWAIIAADEIPSASSLDVAYAASKVAAVHDSLVSQGFVSWTNAQIPQAVFQEYVMLTALYIATAFGKAGDPAQLPVLEGRIRKMSLLMAAPAAAVGAVMSVHKDLVARGKARWTVLDIPAEVEHPYVLLAAYKLAPTFAMKTNPADVEEANLDLNRYIALPSSGAPVMAEYF